MTNEEYAPLKPERMSLFQKVVLGIAIVGSIAFGGCKTTKYQNNTVVKKSDLGHSLQIEYTKYKDGKPVLNFEWTHYKECCEEVITRNVDGFLLQYCKPNEGELLPRVTGVELKINDSTLHDLDCDKKCDEILDNKSYKIIYQSEEDYSEQFKTADEDLVKAEELLNEEIDLEKTVGDWRK